MASNYSIPPELPNLLKTFTREVLRAQPTNIYEFGAIYFRQLLEQQRKAESSDNLPKLLEALFIEADTDGSGFLDHNEFQAILHKAQLGLTDHQIRILMTEADEYPDGRIEYREFVPIAAQILKAAFQNAARNAAQQMVRQQIHGMYRQELNELLIHKFQEADPDGTGRIPRHKLRAVLEDGEIGLTRHEINLLIATSDDNGDGFFSWEEFSRHTYDALLNAYGAHELGLPRSSEEVLDILVQAARMKDPDQSGVLAPSDLQSALTSADMGLTRFQIGALMSLVPPDLEQVEYLPILRRIAPTIFSILQGEEMKNPPDARVNGMERATLTDELAQRLAAFEESGPVSFAQVHSVLTEMGFSPPQASAVESLCVGLSVFSHSQRLTSPPGMDPQNISTAVVVQRAFDVLLQMKKLALDEQ
ncbi:putative radial spoke protein 7 [Paratrimastix pyriformis]|uniref:Radial spoke protein 7 n=1 Tax=Paratrimastix pyriformis TaxID=342808 RepID=A0ABQ8UDY9_9EUKA|nr:putative radial spoke protein 7 [Paratrimastix pyriformis]